MLHRRARRKDSNEAELIQALEHTGCYVLRIEQPVDLLVGFQGAWFTVEVKNPHGRNREQPSQTKHRDRCKLDRLPHFTLSRLSEVPIVLQMVRDHA